MCRLDYDAIGLGIEMRLRFFGDWQQLLIFVKKFEGLHAVLVHLRLLGRVIKLKLFFRALMIN